MKTLIGISSGTSKKTGNAFCCVTIVEPCDEFDNKYGSYGQKADRVFVPEACFKTITPEDLGKEIVFDYEVRGNSARVTSFRIIGKEEPAKTK